MWDACASKRGFVCGREAISIECAAGQGEGRRWNLPYGWERKTKGEMEGRRGERRKGGDSASHVNSLNAPCWPRGCWQHSFCWFIPPLQLVPPSFAVSLYPRCPCVPLFAMLPIRLLRPLVWPCECGVFPVNCQVCWCICLTPESVCVSELKLCALCNLSHWVWGEG